MIGHHVKAAFQSTIVSLPLKDITPLKELNSRVRTTAKYKQIAASLKHVGLIEPLVVFRAGKNTYWLLDGTLRFDIMKSDNPSTDVRCLLASDDESYNYNKRVNYLPPIAEHGMILKALANGVLEERIAEALDINVAAIRKKRHLLDGICEEAVELLKDKRVTSDGFGVLRKMKPVRQIYAAEMMIASNNYSTRFARGLLAVTKPEFLVTPETSAKPRVTTASQKSMMEQESNSLIEDFKEVEKGYTKDLLSLTVAAGYLRCMLANPKIERFLLKRHADILQAMHQVLSVVNEEKSKASSKRASKLGRSAAKIRQ
ncbi:MAG: plasmid partitioning protein RepB C-terminal domain-containing protein [Acidobacteriaceae bacterium]